MNYLNAKQVAELTGYKESYIRWLVNTHQIPNVKIRGKLLFDKQKVIEWFNQNKVER